TLIKGFNLSLSFSLPLVLSSGEVAIRCGLGEKEDKLGSFTKKALQIQLDSLPEVPVLVDVPCVSAQLDDSLLYAVRERVSRHGSVSSHPPVQIEELQERPGSVLVRWCKVRTHTHKHTLQVL
uniref:Uncharacterized protein n=1 Tax=Hucho hucho TaxID=62062 RepID=A0A4W5LHA1_9TELE